MMQSMIFTRISLLLPMQLTIRNWKSVLLRGPNPVLPVRPHEPNDPGSESQTDNHVELVEVLPQGAPVLAQLHAKIGQGKAPRPGTEEGVDVEAAPRHARDARRQSDERADNRQQAGQENSGVTPAQKEAVGPVQFAPAEQDVATVFFDQG